MDIRHLRAFITVAEELHFARAAQRLALSPSPLSRQISALEQEVGVLLFARTKRSVQLTAAGEAFLLEARRTVAQSEQAVQAARRAGRGDTGELAIGFVSTALYTVVGEMLRRYRTRYPQVALQLHELTSAEQVEALHEGWLHVGFVCLPVTDGTLATRSVFHPEAMAALPAHHPLAAQPSVPLAALAQEPLIMISAFQEPGLYQRYAEACLAAGFEPDVVQECAEVHTILGLVAQGLGIGLVPTSVGIDQRAGVVWRPVTPRLELVLAAIWPPENPSPPLRHFLACCFPEPLPAGNKPRASR